MNSRNMIRCCAMAALVCSAACAPDAETEPEPEHIAWTDQIGESATRSTGTLRIEDEPILDGQTRSADFWFARWLGWRLTAQRGTRINVWASLSRETTHHWER